ncbi:flagellar basal body rod protein FlgC [Litorisediminicola beolgyonensis]|uniref:Flagellar basal-body rod protein FlgC n=1 Tax=Litorisediminicola beolgyonensis TaxID=1173614 RepID=A0ABW3ZGT9_9RHOB
MSDFAKSLAVTASGLRAQAMRLRLLSENIANADTPGYRRKTASFEAVRDRDAGVETVTTGRVRLDRKPLARLFEPGHPLADDSGHVTGSNVDLLIEIADAREAQRSYEANLKMFEQAKTMSRGLLDLLRR